MKKNSLKLGLFILLFMCFVLLMPKAIFATNINKIEITIPEPVIGEKLNTDTSKVKIKANDVQEFSIYEINWYCDKWVEPGTHLNNYELITDLNKTCNAYDNYKVEIEFLIPETYLLTNETLVNVNGNKINKNIEEYVLGERIVENINYQSVTVKFKFGKAKVQKEISKIEITTPIPVSGEKLSTDISEFKVKIDDEEYLNITDVRWLTEDFQIIHSNLAEEGKKYNIEVNFNIPNKYGVSSNVIVTVNNELINAKDSNEFHYADSGDLNFDYTTVIKLMETKKILVEESKEEIKEETKAEDNKAEDSKKTETVKTKNPKTGDTITKSFIISIISFVGVILIINRIKKMNK